MGFMGLQLRVSIFGFWKIWFQGFDFVFSEVVWLSVILVLGKTGFG